MEYKVGDRVKIVRCIPPPSPSPHSGEGCWCVGQQGVVSLVGSSGMGYPITIQPDRETNGAGRVNCKPEELQLLKREDVAKRVYDQATAEVDLWSSPTWPTYYGVGLAEESLKGKTMKKLSELEQSVRRVFDADQKALWRTNRIDRCGKWSEEAIREGNRDMVIAHLDANRKEYIDRANEEITLVKEEKE